MVYGGDHMSNSAHDRPVETYMSNVTIRAYMHLTKVKQREVGRGTGSSPQDVLL